MVENGLFETVIEQALDLIYNNRAAFKAETYTHIER